MPRADFSATIDQDHDHRIELIDTGDNELGLTAESDWDGDTETGFGRDVTVYLSYKKVEELRDALSQWLVTRKL
jgi:hypothetical protein